MRKHIAGWSLGVSGILVLGLRLLLYTPPGLALVGRLAAPLTGGQIRVEELGGFFPNHLHVARLEVADQKGVWLEVEQASLDWSALAMLGNHVAIDNVSASLVAVQRRPVPSGTSGGGTPSIDIARLSAPRIVLAAPVIGHARHAVGVGQPALRLGPPAAGRGCSGGAAGQPGPLPRFR